MGLIITVKWSVLPSLGNWRGGANSLGLLDRHRSGVPVSLFKILINCDRPVEFLVCCSVIPVLVGLKSPHTTVSPSGCCDRNESTLFRINVIEVFLHTPRSTRPLCSRSNLFIYQLFCTHACPEGMCTNGTQVPCEGPLKLRGVRGVYLGPISLLSCYLSCFLG